MIGLTSAEICEVEIKLGKRIPNYIKVGDKRVSHAELIRIKECLQIELNDIMAWDHPISSIKPLLIMLIMGSNDIDISVEWVGC